MVQTVFLKIASISTVNFQKIDRQILQAGKRTDAATKIIETKLTTHTV